MWSKYVDWVLKGEPGVWRGIKITGKILISILAIVFIVGAVGGFIVQLLSGNLSWSWWGWGGGIGAVFGVLVIGLVVICVLGIFLVWLFNGRGKDL